MPAESARTEYLPIAEHGLIGDLHTVALVGTDGTIDWYCCPRFDSPSVFAALLDPDRGGRFRVAPAEVGWVSKQLYLPDTAVLITRFLTSGGVGVGRFRTSGVSARPGKITVVRMPRAFSSCIVPWASPTMPCLLA